jgi:hypothetical protein
MWIASYTKVIVTYLNSLLAFLFPQEHHQFRPLSSFRYISKLYWVGGSVVSALAISSSPAPVDAFFFLVPAANPVTAPVVAAFVPLAVSLLVPVVLVSAAFVPLPVSLLVPVVLVSAAFVPLPVFSLVLVVLVSADQIPLALSFSSHFPS